MSTEVLTVVVIDKGIILCIGPNGEMFKFRQRGIQTLTNAEIVQEIRRGNLNKDWKTFRELPRCYSIKHEDEEIMGKAYATYHLVRYKNRLKYQQNKNRI
ncbi:MAG: hypothetical protein IJ593_12410 [Lachnospiraceae bacterium]|nr:hypothetical protein [Lachnospiraceae bacterium]